MGVGSAFGGMIKGGFKGLGFLFESGEDAVKAANPSDLLSSFFQPSAENNVNNSSVKENTFMSDLSQGVSGKVGTALGAYSVISTLEEHNSELSPEGKVMLGEKDSLLNALASEHLSFEEVEKYRKEFLSSEGIEELKRGDFSSNSAFREANFAQFQGAMEIKADHGGLDREQVMKTGAEESSMLGNFAVIGAVLASVFALFKLMDKETIDGLKEMVGGGMEGLKEKMETMIDDGVNRAIENNIPGAKSVKEGLKSWDDFKAGAEEKIDSFVDTASSYLPDFLTGGNEETGSVPLPKDETPVEDLLATANTTSNSKDTSMSEVENLLSQQENASVENTENTDIAVSSGQSI